MEKKVPINSYGRKYKMEDFTTQNWEVDQRIFGRMQEEITSNNYRESVRGDKNKTGMEANIKGSLGVEETAKEFDWLND